jgi:hypothetical protein
MTTHEIHPRNTSSNVAFENSHLQDDAIALKHIVEDIHLS